MNLVGRRLLVVAGGTRATASTRHRAWNYRPYLERDGAQVDWIEYRGGRIPSAAAAFGARLRFMAALTRRLGASDAVLVQKVLPPAALIRFWRARGCRIVYDFDDALFERLEWGESEAYAARRRRRFDRMLRAASHVIAGSQPLAAYARRYNESVEVIYPSLERERFVRPGRPGRTDRLVIGWVGNDQSQIYLKALQPVLREVMAAHPHVRLRVCSSSLPRLEELPADRVELMRWSEAAEPEIAASFDLAVSPLASDGWSQARGGRVSVLLSLAAGVPVVAAPGGGLDALVEGDGGDAGIMFARADGEWRAHLERLLSDADERARRSRAARDLIDRRIWADVQYGGVREALFGSGGTA